MQAPAGTAAAAAATETVELTLAEIFLGTTATATTAAAAAGDPPGVAAAAAPPEFAGLLPLIFAYLDLIHCDAATREALDQCV